MSKQTKLVLTPGLTSDPPIDYSTMWGLKQWTESTKKLSNNLYEGSPQNLKMFLERFASRVITAGWKTITKVDGKDLLTQYGTISGQDLQEYDLMMMAENKYKSLVHSGEWNAPSKEQKEILAISANLEFFTKKKKSEKQDKRKDRFERKKEAPKNIMDTRDKNGKTYHWCTKPKLWTLQSK